MNMKTYVYEYVNNVTPEYHSGGAVLILTNGNPQDEWKEYRQNKINGGEPWEGWKALTENLPEPDFSYGCDFPTKGIWVFGDNGCC